MVFLCKMWHSDFTYFGPTLGSTCARMHYYTVSRLCVLRVMYQNKWIPKFQLSCSYRLFSLKFLTLPNVQNGRFSLKSWRTTATLKCNKSRTIWDRALKLCTIIHFIKAFQMTLTLTQSHLEHPAEPAARVPWESRSTRQDPQKVGHDASLSFWTSHKALRTSRTAWFQPRLPFLQCIGAFSVC